MALLWNYGIIVHANSVPHLTWKSPMVHHYEGRSAALIPAQSSENRGRTSEDTSEDT